MLHVQWKLSRERSSRYWVWCHCDPGLRWSLNKMTWIVTEDQDEYGLV